MLIGNKFFNLSTKSNPDYRPVSNSPRKFSGSVVAGNNTITGVKPEIIEFINSNTVSISGQGVNPAKHRVISAADETITLSEPLPVSINAASFMCWDSQRPAHGVDKPIQAIICVDGANSGIKFYDVRGKLVTIPNGVLVQGGVYYFEIGLLDTVADGAFIGYAPN